MKFQLYQPQAIHELGQRANQEDSIYPRKGEATDANRLFLVCDGMGGHDKGEVASAAVCKGMSQAAERLLAPDAPFTDESFWQVLTQTYDELDVADVNKEGKMGTTMTFLCLHKGGALVAHIGDSRIYHLRPATGEVLYRSRDHSLVQQLYDLGELSYNGMKTSPRKNVILRAMQPYQDTRSKATLAHITDIRPGDYFYMCSDGMLEEMEDDELMSIVGANLSDEEKVDELIRRTAENKDNHSAYLVRIKAVEAQEGDSLFLSDEAELRAKNKALNDTRKDEVWDVETPRESMAGNGEAHTVVSAPPRPAAAAPAANALQRYWPWMALAAAAVAVVLLLVLCGGKNKKGGSDGDESKDKKEQTDSLRKDAKKTGGKPSTQAKPDASSEAADAEAGEAATPENLEPETAEPEEDPDAAADKKTQPSPGMGGFLKPFKN